MASDVTRDRAARSSPSGADIAHTRRHPANSPAITQRCYRSRKGASIVYDRYFVKISGYCRTEDIGTTCPTVDRHAAGSGRGRRGLRAARPGSVSTRHRSFDPGCEAWLHCWGPARRSRAGRAMGMPSPRGFSGCIEGEPSWLGIHAAPGRRGLQLIMPDVSASRKDCGSGGTDRRLAAPARPQARTTRPGGGSRPRVAPRVSTTSEDPATIPAQS